MDKEFNYEIYNELNDQLHFESDQFSRRKVLLTRILKLSVKRSSFAYADIGRVSLDSEQFQKSFIQLKRAIIIEPDDYMAHIDSATALFKLEKEDEAFSHLKKVLSLEPTSFFGHEAVIRRFQEQERLEDLESFYQEIVNQATNTKFIAKLYSGCGQALASENKHPKALEMFKKAFETHEMDPHSHSDYAVVLYHEGFFEEARVQFEHNRERVTGDVYVINNIAYMNYCLGKLQKAFEEFEEIIANGLLTPGTYSNFILVLFHMDKDEEVINRYRDLLQQNLGGNRLVLQSMYEEALRITRVILERDDIDEETREFNGKKIQGIDLVLSFIN